MTKADRALVRESQALFDKKATECSFWTSLHRVQRLLAITQRQELLLRRYRKYVRANASAGVRHALERP